MDLPFLAEADQIAANARIPTPPPQPPPAPPPMGFFGNLGRGLKLGAAVDVPELLGGALEAPGKPGDTLYDLGAGIKASAAARAAQPGYAADPNSLVQAGARTLPTIGGIAVAGMLAAAAGPEAAAGAVAAGVSGALGGGLFGASQFQDTYEKVKNDGGTDADAHAAALQAGAISGAVGAVGPALAGRFLRGAVSPFVKSASMADAAASWTSPAFLKPLGINLAEQAVAQPALMAGQAAGIAAVERNAGVTGGPTPGEAAASSVLPTLSMVGLLAPFGALGLGMSNRARRSIAATAADPQANPEARLKAIQTIAADMKKANPEEGQAWQQAAMDAVAQKQVVAIDPTFAAAWAADLAYGGRQALEVPPQLRLPAPGAIPMGEGGSADTTDPSIQTRADAMYAARDMHEIRAAQGMKNRPDLFELQHTDEPQGPNEPPPPPSGGALTNAERAAQGELAIGNKTTRVGEQGNVEDASVRLRAAKEDVPPGQGTALALGIAGNSAIQRVDFNARKTGEPATAEERIAALREDVPSLPAAKREQLLAAAPEDQPQVIREIYTASGGDSGPKYAQALDALHAKLTGETINGQKIDLTQTDRDIQRQIERGTSEESTQRTAGEAAGDETTRTQSEPAPGEVVAGTAEGARGNEEGNAKPGEDRGADAQAGGGEGAVDKPSYFYHEDHPYLSEEPIGSRDPGKGGIGTADDTTGTGNREFLLSYAEARSVLGQGGKEIGRIAQANRFDTPETASPELAAAAKESFRGWKEADFKRFDDLSATLVRAIELSVKMEKVADVARGSMQDQLSHQIEQETTSDQIRNALKRGIDGISVDKAFLLHIIENDGTAESALSYIEKNHQNATVRAIARVLRLLDLKTRIEVSNDNDMIGGVFYPDSNEIFLGRGGMNAVTVMHELLHAGLHAAIDRGMTAIGALARGDKKISDYTVQERKEIAAVKKLQSIFEDFRKGVFAEDSPAAVAASNLQDFVAETLANPGIQEILGARTKAASLWSRFVDWMRGWLGHPPEGPTPMEQILQAVPNLFGQPDRSKWQPMFSPLDRGHPGIVSAVIDSVGKAVDRIPLTVKNSDIRLSKAMFYMTTLTNQYEMLKNRVDKWSKKFPGLVSQMGAVRDGFIGVYEGIRERSAMQTFMAGEYTMAKRMLAYRDASPENRKNFDDVTFMATEASRLGIDPRKSYPDALAQEIQRKGRQLSPVEAAAFEKQHNSADAQRLRDEYKRLDGLSQRMGAKETPMSLYRDMVTNNQAIHVREVATHARNIIRTFAKDDPRFKDVLNRLDIKAEMQSRRELPQQLGNLVQAITDANKIAKDRAASGVEDSLQAAMTNMHEQYAGRLNVPYFYLGRSGEHMLRFTVAADAPGSTARWDAVGKVVGGSHTMGGLDRAWGPQVGSKRDVYMRFKDKIDLDEARKRIQPLRDAGHFTDAEGKQQVQAGRIDEKIWKGDRATPQFIEMQGKAIDAMTGLTPEQKEGIKDNLRETYLAALPETSALKSTMFRDGDVGYSTDFINTSADRQEMAHASISSTYTRPLVNEAMSQLGDAMKGLREAEGQFPGAADAAHEFSLFHDEAKERLTYLQTPVSSPIRDRMRAITAGWFLAASPGYLIMNAYQPWQVTMPFLGAKFGFGKALGSMGRASALSFAIVHKAMAMGFGKEGGLWDRIDGVSNLNLQFAKMMKKDGVTPLLSGGVLKALEDLQWSGLLSFGQTNQIARMNASELGTIAKATRIASIFSHYVEVTNRLTSMISAYELATTKSDKNPVPMDHDAAVQYARQMVRTTDMDHSAANIARGLGRKGFLGASTPLAVGFQQYDVQMIELIARTVARGLTSNSTEAKEARKAIAGMSVMTAAVAGTLGLPFVGAFSALANAIASPFDDDDPFDAQQMFRQTAAGIFGKKMGEIVSRGLPRALDIDMSSRSGFQDLIPFTDMFSDRRKIEDVIANGALTSLGPAVGTVMGFWEGAHAIHDHDLPKIINTMLPVALRNGAKAAYLANNGFEAGGLGHAPIPIGENFTNAANPWQIITQAAGLTSGTKAEYSEKESGFSTRQMLLDRRKSIISAQLQRAMNDGDYEKMGKLWQESIDFNLRNPYQPIEPSTVTSEFKQRQERMALGPLTGGIAATGRQLPLLQQFNY